MPVFRATFRNQQVVPAVFLVDVRSFGMSSARTVPDAFGFCQLLSGPGIYLAKPDAGIGIAHQVAFAVLEVEGGIDAALL